MKPQTSEPFFLPSQVGVYAHLRLQTCTKTNMEIACLSNKVRLLLASLRLVGGPNR